MSENTHGRRILKNTTASRVLHTAAKRRDELRLARGAVKHNS
jgi:hypothetical protein